MFPIMLDLTQYSGSSALYVELRGEQEPVGGADQIWLAHTFVA